MKNKLLISAVMMAAAFSAQAEINFYYRISGDKQVAPLQAFDDGQNLYLQYRETSRPPVVIGPDGRPVRYDVSYPYVVLPLVEKVQLRYGGATAMVEAAGQPGGIKPAAGKPSVTGENIWYGGAQTAAVTSYAKPPVPASSIPVATPAAPAKSALPEKAETPAAAPSSAAEKKDSSAVPPQKVETPVAEKAPTTTSGAFAVAKPDEQPAMSGEKARPVTTGSFSVVKDPVPTGNQYGRVQEVKVGEEVDSWTVNLLMATNGSVVIKADGSSKSYKMAYNLARKVGRSNVTVKTTGAPRGTILIDGVY